MRMGSFKWSKHNAVYLPEFDREHKNIFRMAEQAYEGLMEGARLGSVECLLGDLAKEAKEHFQHEEQRMRSVGYPEYVWHRRQHDAARSVVTQIERGARLGDREAVLEGLESLGTWLRGHTSVADRMMTAYVRDYARVHGHWAQIGRERTMAAAAAR